MVSVKLIDWGFSGSRQLGVGSQENTSNSCLINIPGLSRWLVSALVGCSAVLTEASAAESLTWKNFVTAKRNHTEPPLPDFSYAGYHGGLDPIPVVKGPIFDVRKYGAKGDGKSDDQNAIQKTIDAAEAAGGGVVFFPSGVFRVNADLAHRRPILIRRGHIVLRGNGSNKGGTIIYIDEPTLKVMSSASTQEESGAENESGERITADWMVRIQPDKLGGGARLATVVGDTARESFVLTVDNPAKIKPGTWITLSASGKALLPDMIAPYKESDLPAEWTRIHEKGPGVQERHFIKSVEGRQVTLREPVKTAIKASHGWVISEYPNISEVGVENICFMGGWIGKFVHHRSWMDDSGWAALNLSYAVDSWVRSCAFINFNACLGASDCANTSILDVVLAGTMGHVSIGTPRHSTGMFYGLVEDQLEHQDNLRDTTHGIGAAGSAVGTVYWRCTMQPEESFDMHGNYPYATLFDAVNGGNFSSSGGPVVSFPNHLQNFVAWNFNQRKAVKSFANRKNEYDFWAGRPSLIMPILVGLHGQIPAVNVNTVSINESPGVAVEPASLYEAQLGLRFSGKSPAWVGLAKAHAAQSIKNLPDFPRGGDNTRWVARKREQIIQMILDTPMVVEKLDMRDPRRALHRQWPTKNGQPWVKP